MKFNKKILIVIDIILLIILVIAYKFIFDVETSKTIYAEETTKFVRENENPVFRVKKIVLWNSAYAVDNSDRKLDDVDISQFTDIELYIDNLSKIQELTAENTINHIYIDNINIETSELNRDVRLNYKNPYNCGKFEDISNYQDDKITFKVITTNEKQAGANFDDSIFYTDCSNPITLGYVNKNFLTNCEIGGDSGIINFDGSILSKVMRDIEQLNAKISFDVHLINNYNEKFICKVAFDIDLTENDYAIYSGVSSKEIVPNESNRMLFFKQ